VSAPARPGEAGFALVEFVAAFTVLTLVVTAALAGAAAALRADRQALFLVDASARAETLLAAARIETRIAAGVTVGVDPDGWAWRREVVADRTALLDEARRVVAWRVRVTVAEPESRGGRRFALETIALGPEAVP
jgi:general secretion pathway protein I